MKIATVAKSLLLAFALVAIAASPAMAAKKEEAKNEYPNASRKDPRLPTPSRAYEKLSKGYDALGKDDSAKAKPLLEETLANEKATKYEHALALRGLAQIALDEDETAKALEYSQRAVDLDALDNKSHFETLYLIAQININEQNYDTALVAIDRWQKESGSTKADAYAMKGNALYRLERYPEAAEALKKAIALSDTPNDSWQQMLAATYQESGDTGGAIQVAEELVKKDPNNKQAALQLAQAYADADQNDKAAAVLDAAYKKGILDDEKALVYLANLYYELEKPAEAGAILQQAIDGGKVKGDETNYTRLGNYWYEAKKVDEAIAAYTKGAATATTGELDYQRGYLLLQEKENLTEGKKAVQAGLAKGGLKHEGEAHQMLGNAFNEEGNCKAAKAEYEKARAFPATKGMADTMIKQMRC
jgi:tetratricopeptide (TPR) repeat protein